MRDELPPARRGWYTHAFDITQPAPARVYDHLMGGAHTFAADRDFGDRQT